MNKLHYFFLIIVLSWTQADPMPPPERSDTIAPHYFCHQKAQWQHLLNQRPELLDRQEQWELEYYHKTVENRMALRNNQLPPPYELPIVVHIIHDNGTENISDAQVQRGIQHLNDAFANRAYYDQGTGVDTRIQFCLAQQDPAGNTTSGINRVVSTMTDMTSETDDLPVKNLIRWNPEDYINIWLVREICSASSGCDVAGYAYFPTAHGSDIDGIMMEARYFGNTEGESGVQIHEMGHYLGLYHTFQGGCMNNDCLRDGDRVCDTPPDQSMAPVRCGDTANSCSTDVNPADPNNPFTSDQEDQYINYMDYGDFDCYSVFTAGQTVRMHDAIERSRMSLLNSKACRPACLSPVTAGFTTPDDTVVLGTTLNFINTSTGAVTAIWTANGILFPGGSYTFNSLGEIEIRLRAGNGDPNCTDEFTRTIVVVCGAEADFMLSSIRAEIGEPILCSNTSIGATSFSWTVNGAAAGTMTNFTFSSTTLGIYEICLTANGGGCETTHCEKVVVVEPDDCVNTVCIEICDNGIDDDGDGLVDYYDADCPCADMLGCQPVFYSTCEVENCQPPASGNWVLNLTPTNRFVNETSYVAVGDIDGDCLPDIVARGALRELYVIDVPTLSFKSILSGSNNRHANFCLGDVDRDGQAEVFALLAVTGSNAYRLARYDWNTTNQRLERSWASDQVVLTFPNDGLIGFLNPSIADFNQDGRPEVYIGNQIFDSETGRELVNATINNNRGGAYIFFGGNRQLRGVRSSAIAVDVLKEQDCAECGGLELVAGNQVMAVNLQSYTDPTLNSIVVAAELSGFDDGTTAVADFDQDGDLDVIVGDYNRTTGALGRVYIWDISNESLIGNPIVIPRGSTARISIPTVGDVDGDDRPEIIINTGELFVLEDYVTGGQTNWGNDPSLTIRSQRASGDHAVAVTLFDFNLDGRQEVVLRNRIGMAIYDADLNQLALGSLYAFTQDESVVVVDIDDDGQAEVVTTGNTDGIQGGAHQVAIYDSGSFPWANTRPIANQHSYLNVNVQDDGSIPIEQQEHHLAGTALNAFNQQYAIPAPSQIPEALATILQADCAATATDLTLEFCNEGGASLPIATPIAIYEGNPIRINAVLLNVLALPTALAPGDCLELTTTLSSSDSIFIMVNDNGSLPRPFDLSSAFPSTMIDECNFLNNLVGTPLPGSTPSILSLGPDQLICENGVFVLDAGNGFSRYRWFDGSTESTNTVFGAGRYWVEVADDCGNLQRDTLIITIDPLTAADLGPDQTACLGDTLTLDAGSFDHYRWYPPIGLNCDTCREFELQVLQDTQLILTAWSDLGCYTTDTIQVLLAPTANTLDTQYLCAGDSVWINNSWIKDEGLFIESFPRLNACDSVSGIEVILLDTVYTSQQLTACDGETVQVFGNPITTDAILIQTYSTASGCDSTHEVTVVFQDTLYTAEQLTACEGETVQVFGNPITTDVILSQTYSSSSGCDSTHEVTVIFQDTLYTTEQLMACDGETVQVFGNPITIDAILSQTYSSSSGCDSTHEVTVIFQDTLYTTEQLTACEGEIVQVFGSPITTDAILTQIYSAASGCDSTHEVTVIFQDTLYTAEQLTACDGEVVQVFGNPITTDAIFSQTYSSASGCDSTHEVTVIFQDTLYTTEQLTACEGEIVQVFGTPITTDAILSQTYSSSSGCDSTHEVTVIFQDALYTVEQLTACDGETVQVFGTPITTDAILSQTYSSSSGCDSTHEVTVIFQDTLYTAEQLTACEGETVQVFGTPITTDAILSQTYNSSKGCDSIHEITLIFQDTFYTHEQFEICAGDTLQVFGVDISRDTLFSQQNPSINGCDSIHEVSVILIEELEELQLDTICPGDFLVFFNDTIDAAGVYQYRETPLSGGCDILYTLMVEVQPEIDVQLVADTTIENGQVIQLPLQTGQTDLQFLWSPANLLSCINCPNPLATLATSQFFTVEIMDEDGCTTTQSIQVNVVLSNDEAVYIPNVFTPNGDQFNDYFTVFASERVEEIEQLQIFDRWGGILYEAQALAPNDPALGWDGTSRGEALNPGVYIYQVILRMDNGQRQHFAGDLTLLR